MHHPETPTLPWFQFVAYAAVTFGGVYFLFRDQPQVLIPVCVALSMGTAFAAQGWARARRASMDMLSVPDPGRFVIRHMVVRPRRALKWLAATALLTFIAAAAPVWMQRLH